MDHVIDRRADRRRRRDGYPEDHVADVADQGERQDAFELRLRDRAEHADRRGEGDDHQQEVDIVLEEQHGLGADDGVDAHLGESRPANTAVTGAGAVGYESGSQNDSGKTAALMLKASSSIRCRTRLRVSCGSSPMRSAICTTFTVPSAP